MRLIEKSKETHNRKMLRYGNKSFAGEQNHHGLINQQKDRRSDGHNLIQSRSSRLTKKQPKERESTVDGNDQIIKYLIKNMGRALAECFRPEIGPNALGGIK